MSAWVRGRVFRRPSPADADEAADTDSNTDTDAAERERRPSLRGRPASDRGSEVRQAVGDSDDDGEVVTAFRRLPESWQEALRLALVDRLGPERLAKAMGMAPDRARVLLDRARAGLQTAWLSRRLATESLEVACAQNTAQLSLFERGELTEIESEDLEEHLQGCEGCSSRQAGMRQLEPRLVGTLTAVGGGALLAAAVASLRPPPHPAPITAPPPVDPASAGAAATSAGGSASGSSAASSAAGGGAGGSAGGAAAGAAGAATTAGLGVAGQALVVAAIVAAVAAGTVATGIITSAAPSEVEAPEAASDTRADATAPSFLPPGSPQPATSPSPSPSPLPSPNPAPESDAPVQPSTRVRPDDSPHPNVPAPSSPVSSPVPVPSPAPSPSPSAPATRALTVDRIDSASGTRPSLTGTGEPGALVRIADDSGTDLATTAVLEDGSWGTGPLALLSPAATMLTATQRSPAGVESAPVSLGPLVFVPRVLSPVRTDGTVGGTCTPGRGSVDVSVAMWDGTLLAAGIDETGESAVFVPQDGIASFSLYCGSGQSVTLRLGYEGAAATVAIPIVLVP